MTNIVFVYIFKMRLIMSQLHIKNIQLFDSILFFDCVHDQVEKRIYFNFVLNETNLSLQYNSTNQFLNFYKFNNLSIESFLLQLIKNTLQSKIITLTEDNLPF